MIKEKFAESRQKRASKFTIRGPLDLAALIVVTAGGAGLIPVGPGTWGSLVGLAIAYGLVTSFGDHPILLQNLILVAGTAATIIGILAGNRAEAIFSKKDPGQVVIDEVAGQIVTFSFLAPYLPRLGSSVNWWLLAGFVLFRVGDIFKPWPVNQLQDLHGGLGIMMDDLLAGLYAAVTLSLLLSIIA